MRMKHDQDTQDERTGSGERAWAVVRVSLGNAQVVMATIALYLLFATGMSRPTLTAVAVTCFFVVLSKFLFRD